MHEVLSVTDHDALRAAAWEPVCGPFAALDASFEVATDDPTLAGLVQRVFADLRSTTGHGRRHARFRALRGGDDGGLVVRDETVLGRTDDPSRTLGLLVWGVNRWILDVASRTRLLLHAGGVVDDGRAVLLPGVSGSGKSTLTAALVRSGLGYLSDEAVELREDGRVAGYAKPLSLDPGAFELFADLAPAERTAQAPYLSRQWQVPAGELSHVTRDAPLAALVFPTYRSGEATHLTRLSPAGVLRAAADATFAPDNGVRVERWQIQRLAAVLPGVPSYTLVHSRQEEAIAAVRSVFTDLPGPA